MRLQSHIFVSGFLRAQQAKGGFGAIARKGSPEAGAVFIVHNRLDGRFCLYGPAPLSFFDDAQDFSRMFEIVLQDAQESEIANYLEKQMGFDPDCWVIEIERRCERLEVPLIEHGTS